MALPDDFPDLRSLDLLLTIAELGSLGKAAQKHGLSQPAVSQRMNHLERLLKVTLLERSPSGTRLTPSGARVAYWSKAIVEAAENFSVGAAALRVEAASHTQLRIAASLTIADHLIPGWLVALRKDLPDVSISLSVMNSASVVQKIELREVDLGFVEGSLPRRHGIQTKVVSGDRLALVVAPGHPWTRRNSPITVSELARTPLILREKGSGTREVLEDALANHGYQVVANMELGSTVAIIGAAWRGEGPAVLSSLAVSEGIEHGHLVEIPTIGIALDRAFRAIWPVGKQISQSAKRLISIANTTP